jgi:hypothetical protein
VSAGIAAATSLLSLVFAVALLDQYRSRRQPFQLVWAVGTVFYAVASGCEALAGMAGWSEALYRTYYLTGAVWTVAWLGLGTAFLLGRTRFGYAFGITLLLAGLFTVLTELKYQYPGAGIAPVVYLLAAIVVAGAILVGTYFESRTWPTFAAAAVAGATLLSLAIMLVTPLPAPGYRLDPATGQPVFDLLPGTLRLLTPYMNVTGAFSLLLGAVFSTYVFMPKRRLLPYSLDPTQPGDQFLFNLLIAPVSIAVNLVVSLPGALEALLRGRLHSRVPATILIAVGAFIATWADTLSRFGDTGWRELGHLLAIACIFAGFLVSIEVFAEIRVPFTGIVLRRRGQDAEHGMGEGAAPGAA